MVPSEPFDKLPHCDVHSRHIAAQNARVGGTIDDLILAWSQGEGQTGPQSTEQLQAIGYTVLAELMFGSVDDRSDDEISSDDSIAAISSDAVQKLRIRQLLSRAKAIRRSEPELINENDPVE